jgi:hypothetical protein
VLSGSACEAKPCQLCAQVVIAHLLAYMHMLCIKCWQVSCSSLASSLVLAVVQPVTHYSPGPHDTSVRDSSVRTAY